MSDAHDFNDSIIKEFRANEGVVRSFGDVPVLLLHTTGAKSGRTRVNPLATLSADDGALYVFASKGGAPTNPDWYHNLLAHPEVQVEFRREHFAATATPVTGAERDRIYAEQASRVPAFADYARKTERVIPVVALHRHE